ncbi:tail fiber assembly protein [Cronobacter sakazakii]
MKYIYDPLTNAFYPLIMKADYEVVGIWPESGVEMDEDAFVEFQSPPIGKIRVAGGNGYPKWSDAPPPTNEQLAIEMEAKKQGLINQANEYINCRQWPGKIALGRLKENEKEQYNRWLDYLDALEEIDVVSPTDIRWPAKPNE